MLAIFGGWIAIWRINVTERDSDTEKRNVQSKSLYGAIQLLGSKKSYARQGALRALEAYIKAELNTEAKPEQDKQRQIRKEAVFELIAGFIQARAPRVLDITSRSDTASQSGAQDSASNDSDVDVRTAIAILRENYRKDRVELKEEPSGEERGKD